MTKEILQVRAEKVAEEVMQSQSYMEVSLDYYSSAREKQRVVSIIAAALVVERNEAYYEGVEAMRGRWCEKAAEYADMLARGDRDVLPLLCTALRRSRNELELSDNEARR